LATADGVTVGGRANAAAAGRGVRKAFVSTTDSASGQTRTIKIGAFGYYRYAGDS
jgi:hypothetical protein